MFGSCIKHVAIAAVAMTALVSGAQASADLAKANNCLSCHSEDKKLVGPAFKDIANKYRGDGGAEARLAEKVKKGGAGVWGPVPMPPNTNLSEADAKKLAGWILGMK